MSRAAVNEKKLAVLEVVREKRNVLFGSCHNSTVRKQEKEEAWTEVLKKAQSLGLASADRGWIYARDHIFGLWKSRTLAKGNNVKTAIDLAIIEILTGTPVLEVPDSSEAIESPSLSESQDYPLDSVGIKTENPELDDQKDPSLDQSLEFKPTDFEFHENKVLPQPTYRTMRGCTKRKWANNDSITFLKKQVLKTELHKNKLLILELERKLGLPPSKFTYDLQNQQ